ncbi:hypothetical protein [Streptomyces coeruleorubidus]|uniref:hypothetical protein n=1 Tax=Streptomyces coeruleorubidus TaxID=116188 RepID=UPI0037A286A8
MPPTWPVSCGTSPRAAAGCTRVVLDGGLLLAIGFLTGAGLTLALVDLADEPTASGPALQALNALNDPPAAG